jgi:peptidoglycan/LPS O-acetylase OafA/YrhL
MLSHFWSLGIEEQFYILWPLLILLFPWGWFRYLFPGIALLSILCKFFFYLQSDTFFTFYDALPISCFDAFGVGAMLALFTFEKSTYELIPKRVFPWLLMGAAVLSALLFIMRLSFLFGVSVAVLSALLILKACEGFSGPFGRILNWPWLLYLGKISYGLYVYHNFMPWFLRCLTGTEKEYPLPIKSLSIGWLQQPYIAFAVQFLILIVFASISWYVLEKPINNLKKYAKK